MKTKNDPYGLKCKINPKIFFRLRGSQKGGVGGGARHLGKIPKKYRFFFGRPPLAIFLRQKFQTESELVRKNLQYYLFLQRGLHMLSGHNTPLKHFHFHFHAVVDELIPHIPLKSCQHLEFRKITWTKIVRYFQCAPRWEIDSDSDTADVQMIR